MSLIPGPFVCDFPPVFAGLGKSLGMYVIEPGLEPVIILNSVLEKYPIVAQGVYTTLYNYHESLAEVYKLFPLTVYYEQLVPPEAVPIQEPEIIFIGRPARQWSYPVYLPQNFRMIG